MHAQVDGCQLLNLKRSTSISIITMCILFSYLGTLRIFTPPKHCQILGIFTVTALLRVGFTTFHTFAELLCLNVDEYGTTLENNYYPSHSIVEQGLALTCAVL